jgi:hypothetical protein
MVRSDPVRRSPGPTGKGDNRRCVAPQLASGQVHAVRVTVHRGQGVDDRQLKKGFVFHRRDPLDVIQP